MHGGWGKHLGVFGEDWSLCRPASMCICLCGSFFASLDPVVSTVIGKCISLPPPYPMRITRVYLQCWQLNHCQVYLLYYVHNTNIKSSDVFGAAAAKWALGAAFEPL